MAADRVRVAVVYQGSLLAEGVRSLLAASDLRAVAIQLDDEGAEERLRTLAPSVVIVDADDEAFRSRSPTALLEPIPEVSLVCLHGGGDHVDVYRKRRVAVGGSRDLAAAIGAA
jgi:hypothetical protein